MMTPAIDHPANLGVDQTQTGVGYGQSVARYALDVRKHLATIRILAASELCLEAEFTTEPTRVTWYNNGQKINNVAKIQITNVYKTCKVVIKNPSLIDEGLYYVVCETAHGMTSSLTYVTISYVQLRHAPTIESYFPTTLEINDQEESRFVCKIKAAHKAEFYWSKNGEDVAADPNVISVDFGCNYVGIQWKHAESEHNGVYTLHLKDAVTGAKAKTSFVVKVIRPSQVGLPDLPPMDVTRQLQLALAAPGAQVCFHCAFGRVTYKYCYVVWYVGRHRVERSNTIYDVLSQGTQQLLYIKKVHVDMGGEVVCELRCALPNSKSLYVNRSTTHLTILPRTYLNNEITSVPFSVGSKVYLRDVQEAHSSSAPYIGSFEDSNTIINQEILDVTFCRLERESVCYSSFKSRFSYVAPTLQVEHYTDYVERYHVLCQWSSYDKEDIWYKVQYETEDGALEFCSYILEPRFTLANLPVGKIAHISVLAIAPLHMSLDENIIICLPRSTRRYMRDSCIRQPLENFEEKYIKTGDLLGMGSFGQVALVKDAEGQCFAAKIIKPYSMKQKFRALRDNRILSPVQHTRNVELVDLFLDHYIDTGVIRTEDLWGGELFHRIVDDEHFTEIDSIGYVKQVTEAIHFLHVRGFAHLNIKPANIVCVSPNSSRIKLVDFGFAHKAVGAKRVRRIYGNRDFIAPEFLNFQGITVACDMWSLGVFTYILLSGVNPFFHENWYIQAYRISYGTIDYDSLAFRSISLLGKNFIKQLLDRNVKNRLTATQALNHPWLTRGPQSNLLPTDLASTKFNLKNYLRDIKFSWQGKGKVLKFTLKEHKDYKCSGNLYLRQLPHLLEVTELPNDNN